MAQPQNAVQHSCNVFKKLLLVIRSIIVLWRNKSSRSESAHNEIIEFLFVLPGFNCTFELGNCS